jgi:hypothetical protein
LLKRQITRAKKFPLLVSWVFLGKKEEPLKQDQKIFEIKKIMLRKKRLDVKIREELTMMNPFFLCTFSFM